jgi:hypothetical protein
VLLAGQGLAAQTPAPLPAHKPVHHHARSTAHAVAASAEAVPAPVTPPAPEMPKWPVNDPPGPASIVWDSHGLRIDATNSSLQQILKEVSTATGTKVEGLGSDTRIFGAFGPGPARDVLSQLLQGSGYNVLMVGDQGQGTPRELMLSMRHTGDAQPIVTPNQSSDEDADPDDAAQPQAPSPNRPGFAPGGPPRTPQQIMQEMQQRQQQMQRATPQN